MITRTTSRSGTKVTFSVAASTAVSVVGDFNGWDPSAHPLRKGTGGVRSATITLAPGAYAFRYLAHGGLFFDEPDADRFDSNEHGGIDGVLVIDDAPASPKKAPADKAPAKKTAAKKAPAKKAAAKKDA
jgi:topoisomerase IA-like protein